MGNMRRYARARYIPGKMNGLESRYAAHLEILRRTDKIHSYHFEAMKLKLANNTTYTPDFIVFMPDMEIQCHEVKGTSKGKPWIEDDAAVKIKVAAAIFPFLFKIIWATSDGWQEREYGLG